MQHTNNALDPLSPTTVTADGVANSASGAGLWPYTLLVLIFVFAGLAGHDPWKADEAYVFGVVQHMLESSDWVVPTLAGEPFMEKPPLFYWVASAFAHIFSGWLPLHDGARMASGFFMLITCWAIGSAARVWWGNGMGRYAVLALVACLGTVVQSHMMLPDIPQLTGFALSALGFASILSKPRSGGALLGLGVGVGFLSKGVLAPAAIGVTAMLLPLCFKEWRTCAYRQGLSIAAVVSLPWCLIWPAALYSSSPALFIEWFWHNNFGRFFGSSINVSGTEHPSWFWPSTIPWFAFPSLPLALWMLWQKRGTALSEPPIQYSLVAFGVMMLTLTASSCARCLYAWPLMVPIAILAAPGAASLPKKFDRLGVLLNLGLFGLFSLMIWTGWALMMFKGAPPDWPFLLRYLPAEFVPRFDAVSTIAATLITIGAFVALQKLWHKPARGLTTWVIGIALTWSLLMTLWLPWLDFAKSYRSVFASMPIPETSNRVASIGLGEGERAMLHYVTGRDTIRRELSPDAPCTTLLVQTEVGSGAPDIDPKMWKQLWLGARPGITNERFWLYRAVKNEALSLSQ